ncbi:MAG: UbiA family prenyltransferase [Gammaproteobacteria bacterium]|nr:UbiA family prenyltransferase [Gammaproteobacteria bacterium]
MNLFKHSVWGLVRDRLRAYGQLMCLHRPIDLPLLIWPAIWSLIWSAGMQWDLTTFVLLVFVLLLLRGAVLITAVRQGLIRVNTQEITAYEQYCVALVLVFLALILILLWKLEALLLFIAVCLAGGYLFLLHRTYLAQVVLAAAIAWPVLAGFAVQGEIDKLSWLLFTAAQLWVLAALILYHFPGRALDARDKIYTLSLLFGSSSRYAVAALQLAALITLFLAGRQEALGIFFFLGLAVALTLSLYQQFLISRPEAEHYMRAYRLNAWWGLAVFCGISFHFLCQAQGSCPGSV